MIRIGLLNLSNSLSGSILPLVRFLESQGFEILVSPLLYDKKASPQQKGVLFNTWIESNTFDYIADVSGGDLANTTLPYLNLEAYAQNKTLFMGYSDLTCVLNALAAKKPTLLFQIQNIGLQEEVLAFLRGENQDLILYQDNMMGGNIRCFLKLAGTNYWPALAGKTLFLESYSGGKERIESYFAQLAQLGAFDAIENLVLGHFTEFFQHHGRQALQTIASTYCTKPIQLDPRIGHQYDSYAILLGKEK